MKKDFEKLLYLLGYVSDEMSKGRIKSIRMVDFAREALNQHRERQRVIKIKKPNSVNDARQGT